MGPRVAGLKARPSEEAAGAGEQRSRGTGEGRAQPLAGALSAVAQRPQGAQKRPYSEGCATEVLRY